MRLALLSVALLALCGCSSSASKAPPSPQAHTAPPEVIVELAQPQLGQFVVPKQTSGVALSALIISLSPLMPSVGAAALLGGVGGAADGAVHYKMNETLYQGEALVRLHLHDQLDSDAISQQITALAPSNHWQVTQSFNKSQLRESGLKPGEPLLVVKLGLALSPSGNRFLTLMHLQIHQLSFRDPGYGRRRGIISSDPVFLMVQSPPIEPVEMTPARLLAMRQAVIAHHLSNPPNNPFQKDNLRRRVARVEATLDQPATDAELMGFSAWRWRQNDSAALQNAINEGIAVAFGYASQLLPDAPLPGPKSVRDAYALSQPFGREEPMWLAVHHGDTAEPELLAQDE